MVNARKGDCKVTQRRLESVQGLSCYMRVHLYEDHSNMQDLLDS